MSTNYNITLSIIFLLLIIILKTINVIKYKTINKDSILYKKEKKLTITLTIISILTFVTILIVSKYTSVNQSALSIILNALPFLVLMLPISIHNLFNTYIDNEEEYTYTKTIITNKVIDKKLLKKYNQANINVVIVSKEDNKLNLKEVKKSELHIKQMRKNTYIKSRSVKDIIEKYNSNMNFIYTVYPEETYNKIIQSRGVCDNYIRAIKYNLITYTTLILSIIFINFVMGFPFEYNLSISLLLKLITLFVSTMIYKNIPSDTDIPTRKQKDKNVFMYKQEILLLIFQVVPIMIGLSMPYMYFLASSTTQTYANTIFYLTFIFSNIFLTYVNLGESLTIKNMIQIIKNKYLFIYTILLVLISIILYYINIFGTERIGIQNIIATIIVSALVTLIYDLVKLARYTTMKGSKKNEHKNNKKLRRS